MRTRKLQVYLHLACFGITLGCARGVSRSGDTAKVVSNPIELPDLFTINTSQTQTFGAIQYTLKGERLDSVFGLTLVNTSNSDSVIIDQDLSQSNAAAHFMPLANTFDIVVTIYPSAPSMEGAFLYGKDNRLKFIAKAPREDRFSTTTVRFEDFNAFALGSSTANAADASAMAHVDGVRAAVVKNQTGNTLSMGFIHTISQ